MKYQTVAPALASVAVVTSMTVAASAQSITTADGDGADASVLRSTPDTNSGRLPAVRAKNAAPIPPAFDRKIYLRFDLTGVSPDIKATSLAMTVSEEANGDPVVGVQQFSVFGLTDGVDEAWGETDITWNTAPANDVDSGSGLTDDAVFLGMFTLAGTGVPGETVQVDAPALHDFVLADADGLLTLIVVRDTFDAEGNGWVHSFASKEHPGLLPPRLSFTSGTCLPDLDGSGDVDVADLLAVLAAWDNTGGAEDIDGSGTVDIGDLLLVLGEWGPCA